MPKVIAGIGSRQTPENILKEMNLIGRYARENKIFIRSGHAEGADASFEQGAQDFCITYLPWFGFNNHLRSRATQKIVRPGKKHRELVNKYHPAPDKLTNGAFALMARNCCQVLGFDLKSPVAACVAYTPNGELTGGTSFALRMCLDMNIPIFNMGLEFYNTAEKVIVELNKVLGV